MLDKAVAYALHCACYAGKDLVHYSENQGAKYATKAIMPQSASLTQTVNIVHLKTQASDSRWHKMHHQKKKIHGAKIDATDAGSCLDIGVAWP